MQTEPSVDRARLLDRIREAYGVPAQTLTFLPVGFVAACYVLDCGESERFFVKLWPDLRGRAARTRLYESLVLTRALHDRGIGLRVPYPIPARDGALSAQVGTWPLALFPLLPGRSPVGLPLPLRLELARIAATLHRSTNTLADVLPRRETFSVPGPAGLARSLAVVERIGSDQRPGLRALRRLMEPRAADVLAQYARLRSLRAAVRRLDGPFVLCHTDIHALNLLVDEQGQISVLDWDVPHVAPPEHDLQAFVGEVFGQVLDTYREAGGFGPLHLEHFAFYLLRRYLSDMMARLERILDANSPEEDEELLRGIEAYGIARWSVLDETLAGIAAALPRSAR